MGAANKPKPEVWKRTGQLGENNECTVCVLALVNALKLHPLAGPLGLHPRGCAILFIVMAHYKRC